MDYKIRPLTRRDRKTLTGLIGKLAEKSKDSSIFSLIGRGDGAKDDDGDKSGAESAYAELAVSMLNHMIEVIDTDVSAWFADLLKMSPEEFDDAPFGIEALVVEQIVESKEVSDFFSSASRVYKKIKKSVDQSKAEKTE